MRTLRISQRDGIMILVLTVMKSLPIGRMQVILIRIP